MILESSEEISYKLLRSYESYVDGFHMHNFYELYLLLDGELNYYINHSCYHIVSGTLVLINDTEVHRNLNLTSNMYSRIYFHIPQSFFSRHNSKEIDLSACFTRRKPGHNNLISLNDEQINYIVEQYYNIKKAGESSFTGSHLLLDTHLIQLLIFVNNIYMDNHSEINNNYPEDINRLIKYLDMHILDSISLDNLSKEFSMSKYYMCHRFKKETGSTILNYLFLMRIAKAKLLLSQGKNVTESCYQSGFKDYTNFITYFKKVTGYTPKKYQLLHINLTP